jgi:hypothetical protein
MAFQAHHEERVGRLHKTFQLVLPSLQLHWRVQQIDIVREHLPPNIDPQTTNPWLADLRKNPSRKFFRLHPRHTDQSKLPPSSVGILTTFTAPPMIVYNPFAESSWTKDDKDTTRIRSKKHTMMKRKGRATAVEAAIATRSKGTVALLRLQFDPPPARTPQTLSLHAEVCAGKMY